MKLTSDHPYWFMKNGLVETYPFPVNDIECDVAVVGAGITGGMVVERPSRDGHSVVALDGRDVCRGSTSASAALLQYEIDVSLTELATLIGENDAAKAYQLSYRSIDDLEHLVRRNGSNCGFRRKRSIHIASTRKAGKALADEYRARRAIGLDCTYHDAEDLYDRFALRGVAALSNSI